MVGYDNLIFGPGLPGDRGADGIREGDERLHVSGTRARRDSAPARKRKRVDVDVGET